ncbi:Protein of unknown function [Pseudosulfitobacter pseudonitzschiae]|uniref:DUF2855 domain-containing protein n=1 Tax=Pseudosulfitobacter pseudonitzschiae TaxID=1402135 RepID=A0A073IY19_9RHOB|nr:DUF2855 family protein [Pseudosulfitobacter pseudonitzschiae]KEJ95268.1 hypothetical protein SUH3_22345 [Pseudosulfitobacter pseudonitzschiae]QKS11512.1 DUF2855 family protein [Pseudosulfitobacter pseudonitzschiae]SHF92297.1 Protein of unknown function [Pseudosulfitobacter pseudonitzschiae]
MEQHTDHLAWHLSVDPNRVGNAVISTFDPVPIEDGEARFALQSFALSANNVTYVQTAGDFGYDTLFDNPAGRMIPPVWGYATVVESRSALEIGSRWYGLWPAGSHLTVRPKMTRAGFRDVTARRSALNPLYNGYLPKGPDDTREQITQASLRPLHFLAYMVSRDLKHELKRYSHVVVTSASSKTSTALAWELRDLNPIGLTSAERVGFVQGTGFWTRVLPYTHTADIGAGSVAVLDVAGSEDILKSIRARPDFGETRVIGIGFTHPESAQPSERALFFAPDRVSDVVARVGAAAFENDLEESARQFLSRSSATYDVNQVAPDGLVPFWADISRGKVDGSRLNGCVVNAR